MDDPAQRRPRRRRDRSALAVLLREHAALAAMADQLAAAIAQEVRLDDLGDGLIGERERARVARPN